MGPNAVTRTAYRLGIESKLEPNASIALGTSEVSVLEMVSAYATFANGGLATAPHVVQRIRSADGKVLYARAPQQLGRIVDARYVGMMNTMMHETLVSGTAKHADFPGWTKPRARPARPKISAMPGSSATARTSSPVSGLAMTTILLRKRPSAAACRSISGAGL